MHQIFLQIRSLSADQTQLFVLLTWLCLEIYLLKRFSFHKTGTYDYVTVVCHRNFRVSCLCLSHELQIETSSKLKESRRLRCFRKTSWVESNEFNQNRKWIFKSAILKFGNWRFRLPVKHKNVIEDKGWICMERQELRKGEGRKWRNWIRTKWSRKILFKQSNLSKDIL